MDFLRALGSEKRLAHNVFGKPLIDHFNLPSFSAECGKYSTGNYNLYIMKAPKLKTVLK